MLKTRQYQLLCCCALLLQVALGQETGLDVEDASNSNQVNAAAPIEGVPQPLPAQVPGPYGPYAGLYGQVPMTRPAWPYPQPVGPVSQGPYVSGYSPGAQGGWTTLPYVVNNVPQPQAAPAQVQPGSRGVGLPDRNNMRPYPASNPIWHSNTGSASPTTIQEVPSQAQPQQQPQMGWSAPQPYWNPAPVYNGYWQPQPQPQPLYQPQLPIWQQPQAQAGQWMPAAAVEAKEKEEMPSEPSGSNFNMMTSVQQAVGWVPGTPSWRRSYTPIPGQPGCFNRCKPSCGRPSWSAGLYGCSPNCRNSCSLRPTCGLRGQVNWAGNTMVCGRSNAGWNGWNFNNGNQYGGYGFSNPVSPSANLREAPSVAQADEAGAGAAGAAGEEAEE